MENKHKPRVALYPAHPAQLWLMKSIADEIKDDVDIIWLLRDKDVLIRLAHKFGLNSLLVSKAKTGLLGNFLEFIYALIKTIHITRKYKIDLFLSKYGAANIASRLCRIKSLSFNDDDIHAVPLIAITSYPFAHHILAPEWLELGKYAHKAIRYKSNHQLIYLNPKRFEANANTLGDLAKKPFIFIRLSALSAHHDIGIKGVSLDFLDTIIKLHSDRYKIVISSESPLPSKYLQYGIETPEDIIHQVLYYAKCVITDSMSMAMEACALGTPSIRLSDFGSRIKMSGLEAVAPYQLIYNYPPNAYDDASEKINEVLSTPDSVYTARREKLLEEFDDPLVTFKKAIMNSLSNSPNNERL